MQSAFRKLHPRRCCAKGSSELSRQVGNAKTTRQDETPRSLDPAPVQTGGGPQQHQQPGLLGSEDFMVDPARPLAGRISRWLESVEPHRRPHDSRPASKSASKSAPPATDHAMADADELASRLTPLSIGPTPSDQSPLAADTLERSSYIARSATISGASNKSLVADPEYRAINLYENHIHLRPLGEQLPHHIATLVDSVRGSKDRNSLGPSPLVSALDEASGGQQVTLNDLWMGAREPKVSIFFQQSLGAALHPNLRDRLQRTDDLPMARRAVPADAGPNLRVSGPVPDMLFGYSRAGAFTEPQRAQLISMGRDMVANNEGLICPFLAVEFKGDGPVGTGSMWVATNQCLGASATCVNMVERLNCQLPLLQEGGRDEDGAAGAKPVDSAAFSIATNGAEARLYVTWKHGELDYYMASVDNFLLYKPGDLIELRGYIRNILDWGAGKRLADIGNALDALLEEGRKSASRAAESRQPPSGGSPTNDRKRQRRSY